MVALVVLPQIGAAQTLFHARIHVLEGKTVEIRPEITCQFFYHDSPLQYIAIKDPYSLISTVLPSSTWMRSWKSV